MTPLTPAAVFQCRSVPLHHHSDLSSLSWNLTLTSWPDLQTGTQDNLWNVLSNCLINTPRVLPHLENIGKLYLKYGF